MNPGFRRVVEGGDILRSIPNSMPLSHSSGWRPSIRNPARGRFPSRFLTILLLFFLSPFPAEPADVSGSTRVDAKERTAIGWSLFEQERWEEALAAFGEAIRSEPGGGEAYRGLAETLYRLGRPGEAARQIRAGLPHLSTNSATLAPLAEILGRTASTRPDAIRILRVLLEARPGECLELRQSVL